MKHRQAALMRATKVGSRRILDACSKRLASPVQSTKPLSKPQQKGSRDDEDFTALVEQDQRYIGDEVVARHEEAVAIAAIKRSRVSLTGTSLLEDPQDERERILGSWRSHAQVRLLQVLATALQRMQSAWLGGANPSKLGRRFWQSEQPLWTWI